MVYRRDNIERDHSAYFLVNFIHQTLKQRLQEAAYVNVLN